MVYGVRQLIYDVVRSVMERVDVIKMCTHFEQFHGIATSADR